MDGTGILTLDGIEVYGTIVPHSVGLRFRCWTREWETLGFFDGQTLAVAHGNEPERPLMVASIAVLDNGNAWIEFAPPIHAPEIPLRPDRPRSRQWIPGQSGRQSRESERAGQSGAGVSIVDSNFRTNS